MFKKVVTVLLVLIASLPLQIQANTSPQSEVSLDFYGYVVPKQAIEETIINVTVPLKISFMLNKQTGKIISTDFILTNNGSGPVGFNIAESVASIKTDQRIKSSMRLVSASTHSNWGSLSRSDSNKNIALELYSPNKKGWAYGSPIISNGRNMNINTSQYIGSIPKGGKADLKLTGKFGGSIDDKAVVEVSIGLKVVTVL